MASHHNAPIVEADPFLVVLREALEKVQLLRYEGWGMLEDDDDHHHPNASFAAEDPSMAGEGANPQQRVIVEARGKSVVVMRREEDHHHDSKGRKDGRRGVAIVESFKPPTPWPRLSRDRFKLVRLVDGEEEKPKRKSLAFPSASPLPSKNKENSGSPSQQHKKSRRKSVSGSVLIIDAETDEGEDDEVDNPQKKEVERERHSALLLDATVNLSNKGLHESTLTSAMCTSSSFYLAPAQAHAAATARAQTKTTIKEPFTITNDASERANTDASRMDAADTAARNGGNGSRNGDNNNNNGIPFADDMCLDEDSDPVNVKGMLRAFDEVTRRLQRYTRFKQLKAEVDKERGVVSQLITGGGSSGPSSSLLSHTESSKIRTLFEQSSAPLVLVATMRGMDVGHARRGQSLFQTFRNNTQSFNTPFLKATGDVRVGFSTTLKLTIPRPLKDRDPSFPNTPHGIMRYLIATNSHMQAILMDCFWIFYLEFCGLSSLPARYLRFRHFIREEHDAIERSAIVRQDMGVPSDGGRALRFKREQAATLMRQQLHQYGGGLTTACFLSEQRLSDYKEVLKSVRRVDDDLEYYEPPVTTAGAGSGGGAGGAASSSSSLTNAVSQQLASATVVSNSINAFIAKANVSRLVAKDIVAKATRKPRAEELSTLRGAFLCDGYINDTAALRTAVAGIDVTLSRAKRMLPFHLLTHSQLVNTTLPSANDLVPLAIANGGDNSNNNSSAAQHSSPRSIAKQAIEGKEEDGVNESKVHPIPRPPPHPAVDTAATVTSKALVASPIPIRSFKQIQPPPSHPAANLQPTPLLQIRPNTASSLPLPAMPTPTPSAFPLTAVPPRLSTATVQYLDSGANSGCPSPRKGGGGGQTQQQQQQYVPGSLLAKSNYTLCDVSLRTRPRSVEAGGGGERRLFSAPQASTPRGIGTQPPASPNRALALAHRPPTAPAHVPAPPSSAVATARALHSPLPIRNAKQGDDVSPRRPASSARPPPPRTFQLPTATNAPFPSPEDYHTRDYFELMRRATLGVDNKGGGGGGGGGEAGDGDEDKSRPSTAGVVASPFFNNATQVNGRPRRMLTVQNAPPHSHDSKYFATAPADSPLEHLSTVGGGGGVGGATTLRGKDLFASPVMTVTASPSPPAKVATTTAAHFGTRRNPLSDEKGGEEEEASTAATCSSHVVTDITTTSLGIGAGQQQAFVQRVASFAQNPNNLSINSATNTPHHRPLTDGGGGKQQHRPSPRFVFDEPPTPPPPPPHSNTNMSINGPPSSVSPLIPSTVPSAATAGALPMLDPIGRSAAIIASPPCRPLTTPLPMATNAALAISVQQAAEADEEDEGSSVPYIIQTNYSSEVDPAECLLCIADLKHEKAELGRVLATYKEEERRREASSSHGTASSILAEVMGPSIEIVPRHDVEARRLGEQQDLLQRHMAVGGAKGGVRDDLPFITAAAIEAVRTEQDKLFSRVAHNLHRLFAFNRLLPSSSSSSSVSHGSMWGGGGAVSSDDDDVDEGVGDAQETNKSQSADKNTLPQKRGPTLSPIVDTLSPALREVKAHLLSPLPDLIAHMVWLELNDWMPYAEDLLSHNQRAEMKRMLSSWIHGIDNTVTSHWGVSEEDLEAIRKRLARLKETRKTVSRINGGSISMSRTSMGSSFAEGVDGRERASVPAGGGGGGGGGGTSSSDAFATKAEADAATTRDRGQQQPPSVDAPPRPSAAPHHASVQFALPLVTSPHRSAEESTGAKFPPSTTAPLQPTPPPAPTTTASSGAAVHIHISSAERAAMRKHDIKDPRCAIGCESTLRDLNAMRLGGFENTADAEEERLIALEKQRRERLLLRQQQARQRQRGGPSSVGDRKQPDAKDILRQHRFSPANRAPRQWHERGKKPTHDLGAVTKASPMLSSAAAGYFDMAQNSPTMRRFLTDGNAEIGKTKRSNVLAWSQ